MEHEQVCPNRDAAILAELAVLRQRVAELEAEAGERRKAEEALRASGERYRRLIESCDVMVFSVDRAGVLRAAGGMRLREFGLKPEDVVGRSLYDLFPREEANRYHEQQQQVFQTGTAITYENTFQFAGLTRTDLVTNYPILDESGEVELVGVICRDITERKRVEAELRESEARYHSLYENSLDAVLLTAPDGRILAANPAACRVFGRTEEEICQAGRNGLVDPKDLRVTPLLEERARTGQAKGELFLIRKDGTRFPAEVSSVVFEAAGGIERTSMIVRDLTERHMAEEVLRERDREIRLITDNVAGLVSYVDRDGRYRFVNKRYEEWFGLSLEEIVGKHCREVLGEAAYERIRGWLQAASSGQTVRYEEAIPYAQGGLRWVDASYVPDADEQGNVKGFFALVTDITERKRAEEALARERILLRTVIDNLPDAVYVKDTEGRKMLSNPTDVQYMGLQAEAEVLGKTDWEMYPPETAASFYADDQSVVQTGTSVLDREESSVDASGERHWWLASKIPLRDESGQVIGLVGIGHDITESKRVEAELARERILLRTVIDNLPGAIYVKDTEGRKVLANPTEVHNSGFETEAEVLGKTDWEVYPPELAASFDAHDQLVLQGGTPLLDYETLVTIPNGEESWWLTSKLPLWDESGQITGIVGISRDITERKRAEEALRESEEWFRRLYEQAPLGYQSLDAEGCLVDVNQAWLDLLGYSRDEVIGHWFGDFLAPQEVDAFRQRFPRFQAAGEVHTDVEMVRSAGSTILVHIDGRIGHDEHGQSRQTHCILHDTTERKRTEESLARERILLRTVIDNLPDVIYVKDTEARKVLSNPADVRAMGLGSEGEALGKTDWELFPPDLAASFDADDQSVLQTGTPILDHEVSLVNASGERRWWSSSKLPLRDTSGQTIGIVGIAHDITERKRAEEEQHRLFDQVRAAQEQLRELASYLQAGREEERTRIARELHDEFGQMLTALKMDLAWMARRLGPHQLELREKTRSMSDLVSSTIQAVRRVATELRPGLLDDLGLSAAVEWQAQEFRERTGISCELHNGTTDLSLGRDLDTTLFRIFQEALTNVARHAQATQVHVELTQERDSVTLIVRDNGRGITASQLSDPRSLGLTGMRERARAWGGEVTLEGHRGEGTTMCVRIPLVAQSAE